MTEENLRTIKHYKKLKQKLIISRPKRFDFSPKFTRKDSLMTTDSVYSVNNKTTNINISESSTYKNLKPKLVGNNVKNIEYIYSPRTSFVLKKDEEEKLYHDICIGFDPMTIKIMKSYFKERLGELNEIEFISILKNYLPEWYTNLPDRENIMVKLLSRLFKDIDLNCNEIITWENFIEYLTNTASIMNKKKLNYELRFYINSKKNLENIPQNELISYAFYIEKFNLIGIVLENSSIIDFYNADTLKKVKAFIDAKKTQIDIDQIQLKEFDIKAKELIEHEIKMNKIKLLINEETRLNSFSLKNINLKERIDKLFNEIPQKTKRVKTPEKLREEIRQINSNNDFEKKKKDFNKKLTILATCFVDELDILFVSSSNNKISAWQYINAEFVNINQLEEDIETINKLDNKYAVFDSFLPQYTLDWEPIQKRLYSGQADGKILVWDIHKSKNLENFTLDFHQAKKQKEEEIQRKINEFQFSKEAHKLSQLTNSKRKENMTKFDNRGKQNSRFNLGIKMLIKIKKDMSRESVSCIKVLGKMQIIAAGYYNGNVILWDTLLHDYRKFYSDQNTGIYQIEYNIKRNLIFSCGFDHSIYIYDPFIDSHCVQKLVGHNYSINSIACNIDNDEFISIDIIGNIKIWDLNNFYNFQTININEAIHYMKKTNNTHVDLQTKISSNQKMIFLSKVNKILTYGEKLMIFGKESYYFPDICDSQSVLSCFYNPRFYIFYVVCLNKIKLWNIFNGRLVRVYEEFLQNSTCEITCTCTDENINKLYIGDNFGHIICLNLNYGNIIKEFIPHKKEISSLHYLDKDNLLISLSIDNIIKIHNENDTNEKEIQKEIYLDNINITTLNISNEYPYLIIGTSQGELKYFNISHLKLESYIIDSDYKKRFKNDPIINTLLLDEYPICLICHESSKNIFEIIPPSPYKYTFFGEFLNFHIFSELNNEKVNFKIISLSADKKNGILFFGDMQGYVNCYSIKKLLEYFDKGIFDEDIKNIQINKDKYEKNNKLLKNYQIEYISCFKAHNESIKFMKFFDINPSILITIGTDRKVKLFSPKGEYIDEFRQSMEKNKEVPIGIKYYYADPFISKVNSDEFKESNSVYRNDIENYRNKRNRIILNNMRKSNLTILEYSNKITEYKAKERLHILTKNCGLANDRSTNWNYLPDMDFIISEEKKDFNTKMEEIKQLELKYNLNSSYEAIYSQKYHPKFFKDIDEIKVKEFGDKLNQKMKVIKLAISKYEKNSDEYKIYENEMKRIDNITYKNELKLIHGNKVQKKIKTKKIAKYDKNRNFILGLVKNKFNNLNKQFNYYKEDFNRYMEQLENRMEEKINISINRKKTNINSNNNTNNKNKDLSNDKKIIDYLKTNDNIKRKLSPLLLIKNNLESKSISPIKNIMKSESSFKKNKIKLKKVHFE